MSDSELGSTWAAVQHVHCGPSVHFGSFTDKLKTLIVKRTLCRNVRHRETTAGTVTVTALGETDTGILNTVLV
jgi:hypothetical protein